MTIVVEIKEKDTDEKGVFDIDVSVMTKNPTEKEAEIVAAMLAEISFKANSKEEEEG